MISFKDKILNHNSEYDPSSWKKFQALPISQNKKRNQRSLKAILGINLNSTFKFFAIFSIVVLSLILFFYFTNKTNNVVSKVNLKSEEKTSISSKNNYNKYFNNISSKDDVGDSTFYSKTKSVNTILIKKTKTKVEIINKEKLIKRSNNLEKSSILNSTYKSIFKSHENNSHFPNSIEKNHRYNTNIYSENKYNAKRNKQFVFKDGQTNLKSTNHENSILNKLNYRIFLINTNKVKSNIQAPSVLILKNRKCISLIIGLGFGLIENRKFDSEPKYTYSIYGKYALNPKFYLSSNTNFHELYLGNFSETINEDNHIVSTLQFVQIRRKQLSNSLSLGYNIASTGFSFESGILYQFNLSHSMTGTKIDRLDDIIISKIDLSNIKLGSSFSWGYTFGIGYNKYFGRYNFKTELKYSSKSPSTPGIKTNFKVANDNISLSIGLGYLFTLNH